MKPLAGDTAGSATAGVAGGADGYLEDDWTIREFGGNSLPDGRLRHRLIEMCGTGSSVAAVSVAEIFPAAAGQQAAY